MVTLSQFIIVPHFWLAPVIALPLYRLLIRATNESVSMCSCSSKVR